MSLTVGILVEATLFVSAVIMMTILLISFRRRYRKQVVCIEALVVIAADLQSPDIRDHCERVATMSENIARELKLPRERISRVRMVGFLHEVRKIDSVFNLSQTESSILEVADYFITITHDCREPLTLDDAIEEIRREAGTRFNSAVVKALMTVALRSTEERYENELAVQ